MIKNPQDIVILSNGPGEITTWVYPVVKQLRIICKNTVRISVILSPCPHSTGKEAEILTNYSEVDRVQKAEYFWQFLLLGKTKDNWDWYHKGIVLFLGGDQFYTALIGKKLGYKTLIYAEWDARWYRFIDCFAVMKSDIINSIPKVYQHKFTVVGDLMADVHDVTSLNKGSRGDLIGLLPGSKTAKLMQGIPLCLAIAEQIQKSKPEVKFVIPVAPTLDTETLAKFANPEFNPLVNTFGGITGNLIKENNTEYLITNGGVKIELITEFPCYERLVECSLCLTTVGANTAQLCSLAIPMIVLLPTQQLDAMRSWDGIPGILANLPGVGTNFAKLINWLMSRKKRLFAWPNIWAKAEIIPELVGELQPKKIANLVISLLKNPEKLEEMKINLGNVRGESGAAEKIVNIVSKL